MKGNHSPLAHSALTSGKMGSVQPGALSMGKRAGGYRANDCKPPKEFGVAARGGQAGRLGVQTAVVIVSKAAFFYIFFLFCLSLGAAGGGGVLLFWTERQGGETADVSGLRKSANTPRSGGPRRPIWVHTQRPRRRSPRGKSTTKTCFKKNDITPQCPCHADRSGSERRIPLPTRARTLPSRHSPNPNYVRRGRA